MNRNAKIENQNPQSRNCAVYTFIDSQNLHLGVKGAGWELDYKKLRTYLSDKYQVKKAYLFIGYIAENKNLYENLRNCGYICIFRPTIKDKDGRIKGNCDAELVLHSMIEYPHYDKAIIISGDGDFQCLAKYLHEQKKLAAIMVPNQKKYSALLKTETLKPYVRFISNLQTKLGRSKKEPP
jgi:uncharacterized LabA/DUF88 family protein